MGFLPEVLLKYFRQISYSPFYTSANQILGKSGGYAYYGIAARGLRSQSHNSIPPLPLLSARPVLKYNDCHQEEPLTYLLSLQISGRHFHFREQSRSLRRRRELGVAR